MILDNEEQRDHLLSLIAATPLAAGTVKQLRPQIDALEKLEMAISTADLSKGTELASDE